MQDQTYTLLHKVSGLIFRKVYGNSKTLIICQQIIGRIWMVNAFIIITISECELRSFLC